MSKNLAQVFAANPITTIGNTDVLYVVTTDTTDAAINGANLKALFASSTLSSGNIYVGSAGNVATSVTMSGDGALSNAGALTISKIGASTITIGGSVTYSGAFTFTGTLTNTTAVTFPTSGTLATTTQVMTNVNQNSSSATLAANSRYATNNGASLVTYTIPAGAAVGDTFIIVGGSSGGWTVAQPASVQIHLGSSATTSGATGTLSSSNQYDCVTITCVASNVFTAYGVQGNLTVV